MKRISLFSGGLKPPSPMAQDEPDAIESRKLSFPSLASIRGSLSRSVSARSRRSLVDDRLCRQCRQLDLQKAYDTTTASPQVNGFLVCKRTPSSLTPTCKICKLFEEALASTSFSDGSAPVQLRAFPLLSVFIRQSQRSTPNSPTLMLNRGLCGTYVLACFHGDKFFDNGVQSDLIDAIDRKSGFLCWQAKTEQATPLVRAKEVPAQFEPQVVQDWLGECQKAHANCLPRGWLLWVTKVIDCSDGRVVSVSSLEIVPDYVALSYVWGEPSAAGGKAGKDRSALPQVVKDAISVTKALGFRYLWVDRYCMEQNDRVRKHEQIMNMDSIYENAALTIIAAPGLDLARGLPGVSSTRVRKEVPFQHENFTVSWIPPSPHAEILDSRWSTRGWTYQEATLSRRRLVFTDQQVYFECRSMTRCESLHLQLSPQPEKEKQLAELDTAFRLPHVFSIPLLDDTGFASPPMQAPKSLVPVFGAIPDTQASLQKAVTFNAYTQCVERYSQRTLTFDSDSLNAFGGMIKRFETLDQAALRHLWGIPFFDQRDDRSPEQIVDYAGFLLAGLCWHHGTTGERPTGPPFSASSPSPAPPRRRNKFPSWSGGGWSGAVTWPRVGTTYEVRAPDPNTTLASIQLSFEDGSTRSIPDVRAQRPGGGPSMDQYPRALLLQTSAVESGDLPARRMWLPSSPGRGEERMVQQIQSGDLKALRLGAIGENGYLLVVKKKGRSYYRVGLMRVSSALVTERVRNQDVHVFKLK